MRIASTLIRYRDVIASAEFVGGRRWSSPSTGASLVIVGRSGDADDQGRAESLYVEDDRLSWKDMPELRTICPGHKLARRLDPGGVYRRTGELICIPVTGKGAIDQVRLLGYGPDEWLRDGITGTEIEALDRKSDGWKTVIWTDPERMSFIPALKIGQLIRSEQFAHAHVQCRPDGTILATLYHSPEDPARFDADRGTALFRVEAVDIREEWHDLGDYYSCRVRARRLGADGMPDKREVLEFQQQMDVKNEVQGHPFRPVELILDAA